MAKETTPRRRMLALPDLMSRVVTTDNGSAARAEALRELQHMSASATRHRRRPMFRAGILPPLAELLQDARETMEVRMLAAAVFWNLAAEQANQVRANRTCCVSASLLLGSRLAVA